MWPKMLLELLPHLSRLIPAADTYLNSRKESDKTQAAALTAMTEEVRSGLTKAAEEQAAFRLEFQAHIASSAQLAADAARTRMVVETVENRLANLESRLTTLGRLLWASLVVLAVVVVLLAIRGLR
jgi:hypothetical protein